MISRICMLYAQMYMYLAILCRVYKKPNLSEADSLVAATSLVVLVSELRPSSLGWLTTQFLPFFSCLSLKTSHQL